MTLLTELLEAAGLPDATSEEKLSGRGFDTMVTRATLADGQQVILRQFRTSRPPEHQRARFLASHGVPAPAFLAGNDRASLHAFVPGVLLGDLIEAGAVTADHWRSVGRAFRKIHDIRFPALLMGEVAPDRIILHPYDPVAQIHGWIDGARSGLQERSPRVVTQLPILHEIVDHAAIPLRAAGTSLGHGDINMWNVIVSSEKTTPIDWDYPRICDPALEVALLDKHASLFNGHGLDNAFFEGYGRPASEPTTSIHRVVATLQWVTSADWAEFERDPVLPAELKERARDWQVTLWEYVERLTEHIARIQRLL